MSFAFKVFDGPGYKNLKVLPRHISKEALDSTMKFYCVSLGVKCGFCHYRDTATQKIDFTSDQNPNKLIARNMIRMNERINKKYFRSEDNSANIQTLTCYTCHRGAERPLTAAPPKPLLPVQPPVQQ